MIRKDMGFCNLTITDSEFGAVVPGDETFLERYRELTGEKIEQVVWMNQVHGIKIQRVEDISEGITVLDETDGVWTDRAGLMLISKTADCVPILMWNKKDQVIAAIHCGWRGFLQGIIETMAEEFEQNSLRLEDFSVFLGPHLRVDDFEVQQDFIDQVPEAKMRFLLKKNNKNYFDITKGVIETLKSFGVKNISDSGINTYNNPEYFSYRHWSQQAEDSRAEKYSTFANCIIIPN